MVAANTTVDTEGLEETSALDHASAQRSSAEGQFWFGVVCAVALGAVVRFTYLFNGAPSFVKGDGFDYYLSALRLADGFGYTVAFGDVGAENAHHPPGWITVLAGVAEAGARSMWAHQVTGVVIGLGLILVAGLVGRRYVGPRVGVVAAILAAVYPGFWVLEVQILSEPLGLLVLGVLMLLLADLWQRPTLVRAVATGAVSGALALVRSEQVALLVIAVAPLLVFNPRLGVRRRLAWTGATTAVAIVVISPWTIHNLGRFEEPVLLSTNGGTLLLVGNCPPSTYGGERMGFIDTRCLFALGGANPDFDRSQTDVAARKQAFENMRDNLDRLPTTIPARYGRMTATFRTTWTIGHVSSWLGIATWPVWAWVTSFWVLMPLAVYGSVALRRSRTFQWPLVAPVVVVLLTVGISYGEPRYHTPGDLGIVVLAAVALDRILRRVRRATRWRRAAPLDDRQALGGHTDAGALGTSGMRRTTTSTGPA